MPEYAWPAELRPSRQVFYLQHNTLRFLSPVTRQAQVLRREGARWVAELTFDPLNARLAGVLEGLLAALAGCSGANTPAASVPEPLPVAPELVAQREAAGIADCPAAPLDADAVEASLYDRRFLLARPVLEALQTTPSVLLVDEVDRADDEFEAFLLEVLSTYQVTIPELGTVQAATPPTVVLTSNRTR